MHLPRALFITLACYFPCFLKVHSWVTWGLIGLKKKWSMANIFLEPAFEQCTAFGDRYANIATIEDEGENKSGNYFFCIKSH
jgi:hypothetical protein